MRYAVAFRFALAAFSVVASPWTSCAQESGFAISYGIANERVDPAGRTWTARVARARMGYEAFAARAIQKFLLRANLPRERTGLDAVAIMDDPTLRVGDIYAGANGFMIFRGRLGLTHKTSDFAPMPAARARKLSLAIAPAQ
ncbi:hypothetical protein [Methylocystis parvus]|uniref:Uncharacterized protein n=1 Tax=Methylocystis parvus TaxID=134 RepID=A0A6B8M2S0_9HYPH|nr:hypothetical protein [Methylocystis parvus]QGM96658.1 hypothetical protein F7D14_03595 [Methylocystis parvus]WBJ99483.1 hypothetical protein MMG94_16040 [Methylocystis parvus OBBP]